MFCVDWSDDNPLELLGREQDDDHIRIELILVPCNFISTALDKDDQISPECIADLDQ